MIISLVQCQLKLIVKGYNEFSTQCAVWIGNMFCNEQQPQIQYVDGRLHLSPARDVDPLFVGHVSIDALNH